MKRLISIFSCLAVMLWALAIEHKDSLTKDNEPIRPVASSYMLQLGYSNLEDTYLTPLKYTGTRYAIQYEGSQAMKFNPKNWIMRFDIGLEFDLDENPAKNATMGALAFNADWNMIRRWNIANNLSVGIGAGPDISVGALYLSRNGNNPVSAKAAFTLDATGYACWSHKLWRVPFTLRYQFTLPVTGCFFSPNYGQLYYQIYMGDKQKLAHTAWWGNYFLVDNIVSADIHLGYVSLRVGYRGKIFSSKVNNLISNDFSHSLVLGITTDWITLSRNNHISHGEIIRAY